MNREFLRDGLRIGIIACVALARANAGESDGPAWDFRIPYLQNITIDGRDSDWAGKGLRVLLMPEPDKPVPSIADQRGKLRLGWNEQGLLVLVDLQDDAWLEGEDVESLWQRDSVEVFLAPARGHPDLCQWVIAPGVADSHPALRWHLHDFRTDEGLKAREAGISAAREILPNGCRMEVSVPWTALGIQPEKGRVVGFQLWVNDVDPDAPTRISPVVWFPQTGSGFRHERLHRLRLSEDAGPDDLFRSQCALDMTRREPCLTVLADPDFIGREVSLRSPDGRTITDSVLFQAPTGYAQADLRIGINDAATCPAPVLYVEEDRIREVHLCSVASLREFCESERPVYDGPLTVKISTNVLNRVDRRIFGQFMERKSGGDPGYDAARVPNGRELQPQVVRLMEEMSIPLIRFPAGGDLCHIDWRDMIDHAPGREGRRPPFGNQLSNEFGIDEFLALCAHLQCEPLLVLNVHRAFARQMPLQNSVLQEAGLVAYCNAPQGARLPDQMPDWPSVRRENGHAEPYGVRYFQLGNEMWNNWESSVAAAGLEKASAREKVDWLKACYQRQVAAVRSVNPQARILFDLRMTWDPSAMDLLFADEEFYRLADFIVIHEYRPLNVEKISLEDGSPVKPETIPRSELLKACVAVPNINASGLSVFEGALWEYARNAGFAVAVTEWNWNGWSRIVSLDSELARGIGAAGFLHAMIRDGDTVRIGCQSSLAGSRWQIQAILADPTAEAPPVVRSTGQVTGLYSRYHGDRRLAVEITNAAAFCQPYILHRIRCAKRVSVVDAVATADEEAVYVHCLNRDPDRDVEVRFDLSDLQLAEDVPAVVRTLSDDNDPSSRTSMNSGVRVRAEKVLGGQLNMTLPAFSVNVVHIPRDE